jgi:hypothetical protein
MKRIFVATVIAVLSVMGVGFFSLTASAQEESHIITFQAPGADTTPGSFDGTFADSINNARAITGYYLDANNVFYGFLRSREGKFTTFQAPGADTTPGSFSGTNPTSINDLGAITGYYLDANGVNHGFLRNPKGEFTTFDVSGAGGYGSFPIFISREGAIVGYYTNSIFNFQAFLRHPDGTFKTFVGPGACDTGTSTGCYGNEATNINLSGTSVGNYMDNSVNLVGHGLIRRADGTLISFEAPGAGNGQNQGTGCPGCSAGLNQWGAIAATYTDANTVHHGFLRSPKGEFTTFDAPGAGTGFEQGTGCFSDCPVSLNDWGATTGIYIDANYEYHGYVRSPEGKFTTVDPAGSTGTLPFGINDSGAITGYYIDANNVYHGFLRIPDE